MSTETKKYLDLNGLKKYDELLKGWTGGQISAAIEAAAGERYTKDEIDGFISSLEEALNGVKSTADSASQLWTYFLDGLDTAAPTLKAIKEAIEDYETFKANTYNKEAVDGLLANKLDSATYDTDKAAIDASISGLDGRLGTAEQKIEALSNATYFKGVTIETDKAVVNGGTDLPESIYKDGATAVAGDVVVSGNKEFIWDGSKWIELGDTTAELSAITKNAEDIAKKLDSETYTNDKATIEANIAKKADADKVYDKDAVDGLLANKLDSATYATDKAAIEADIAKKLDSETYANDKATIEANIAKKLDSETYATDKAAIEKSITDGLAEKLNIADYITYEGDDSDIAQLFKA